MMNFGEERKVSEVLLDGYNNPGFSGGPIVYRDLNQSSTVIRLAGVVSGFRPEVVPMSMPLARSTRAWSTRKADNCRHARLAMTCPSGVTFLVEHVWCTNFA
jgi:hypothetical protein